MPCPSYFFPASEPDIPCGVGHHALRPFHFCIDGQVWFAVAVAVASHDPDSLPDVGGVFGTSRNNNRPRCVAIGFQVSKHLVEPQRDVTNNIFSKYPSGSDFANNSAHLRPEVTRIFVASLLPGVGKGLARVAAADEVDSTDSIPIQSVCCNVMDVVIAGDVRPMLGEDGTGERFDLTEGDGSHPGSLESETESADP